MEISMPGGLLLHLPGIVDKVFFRDAVRRVPVANWSRYPNRSPTERCAPHYSEYRQSHSLSAIDRIPGPIGDRYPADSIAEENLSTIPGRWRSNPRASKFPWLPAFLVRHNSIYRVPRAGITWGWHLGWASIVDNDVFDTVLETGDHGAFNSWGRDRYWTLTVLR